MKCYTEVGGGGVRAKLNLVYRDGVPRVTNIPHQTQGISQ